MYHGTLAFLLLFQSLCTGEPACKGFNFKAEGPVCELASDTITTSTGATGFVFYGTVWSACWELRKSGEGSKKRIWVASLWGAFVGNSGLRITRWFTLLTTSMVFESILCTVAIRISIGCTFKLAEWPDWHSLQKNGAWCIRQAPIIRINRKKLHG